MSQFGFSKWVCHSLVYTQEYNPNLEAIKKLNHPPPPKKKKKEKNKREMKKLHA